MGYNHFVATVLMKSVCVVAVYANSMLMLLLCWPGVYCVCVCVCRAVWRVRSVMKQSSLRNICGASSVIFLRLNTRILSR